MNIFPTRYSGNNQNDRQIIETPRHMEYPQNLSWSLEDTSSESDRGLNPRLWAPKKKAYITTFVVLTAFTATLGTPIYVGAIQTLQHEYKLTLTQAILPSSLYAAALGLGALFTSDLSEIYGRLIIYKLSLPGALVLTALASVSTDFTYLVLFKTLSGIFSGPSLTVGVGVLNDMWDPKRDRGGNVAAVIFVLTLIWATQIGPIFSISLIETRKNWRWVFHISSLLLIMCTICLFFIPETNANEIERRNDHRLGRTSDYRHITWYMIVKAICRPLHMLKVEPILLTTSLVLAITQSVIFSFYVAYAYLFESVYNFTPFQVGLTFLPLAFGSLCAVPVLILGEKLFYQGSAKEVVEQDKMNDIEKRLYPAIISSFIMPISLFWLAWTGSKEIPWIVPILSGSVFGFSYVLNMLCLPVYNNDIYPIQYGTSVLAASTFLRFLVSPGFLIVMPNLLQRVGSKWSVSLLGFVTMTMSPIPWIFLKYGPWLRAKSKYIG